MITATQLDTLKMVLDNPTTLKEVVEKLEQEHLMHQLNSVNKIQVEILLPNGEEFETVLATKINSVFCYHKQYNGKSSTHKTITHIPSGKAALQGTHKQVMRGVKLISAISAEHLEAMDNANLDEWSLELRHVLGVIHRTALNG